ncbi:MAG: CPBP family intramembrane glutamic endopeptidase [Ignavibacteriaceae bacterium]
MKILKWKIFWFYLMAIIFSWTLFFITDAWLIPKYANTTFSKLIALYGHMLAMMGPMFASIIMLKYFQNNSLLTINWSNKKYYLYTIYAILIIWIIPGLMLLLFDGNITAKIIYDNYDIIFIVSYILFGWLAGVGEEYGWSGYILTELSGKFVKSKAVVVSGILRGLWHLPLIIIPLILKVSAGEKSILELFLLTPLFAIQLIVSNIFFSALFGFVWYKTNSIPLLGWMHFLFDLGRDFTILFVVGFSSSFWFKFGWSIPFIILTYLAFNKIAKEDGYSNILEIFYRRSYST